MGFRELSSECSDNMKKTFSYEKVSVVELRGFEPLTSTMRM